MKLRQKEPRRHIRPHESPVDLAGQRFGSMVVLDFAAETSAKRKISYWRIKCDCGKEMDKRWCAIRDGVRCGGCTPTTHGDARRGASTTEWRSWNGMIDRCTRETNDDFHHYGGRGIKVCDRWLSYPEFLSDMGRKPSPKHTIERVDTNGNYTPPNCIWALQVAQVRNRRNTVRVFFQGQIRSLSDAAELAGLHRPTVYSRLRLGWTPEQTLSTPILEYGVRRPK